MSLVHEIDYGTPASKSGETVKLTIDGMPVTVPSDELSAHKFDVSPSTPPPKRCVRWRHRHRAAARLPAGRSEGRAL